MRRTRGWNVKVSDGFVSVDWDCPYCSEYNAGFYYSSDTETLSGDFEIDHECDNCERMVTIECPNDGVDLFDCEEEDRGCDWFCDSCGAYMNTQPGFTALNDEWECAECGALNDTSEDNIDS